MSPWIIGGIAAGAGALLYLLWPSSKTTSPPLVTPQDRIWVIGDSQGVGLLPELKKLSAAQGGAPEVNGGPVGGLNIWQWINWGHMRATEERPAVPVREAIDQGAALGFNVCLVVLGTNDAASDAKYIANEADDLDRLLAYIESLGMRPIWVGPPKLPAQTCPNVQQVVDMIEATGVPYLDSREIDLPMWHTKTGEVDVHPNIEGRKIWARWIWDQLGLAQGEGTATTP